MANHYDSSYEYDEIKRFRERSKLFTKTRADLVRMKEDLENILPDRVIFKFEDLIDFFDAQKHAKPN